VLLIEEAGGSVTNFRGGPLDIYSPRVIASNGFVHQAMMRVLSR
jgi:myo-inositol-1(or 4)-monophosphatase